MTKPTAAADLAAELRRKEPDVTVTTSTRGSTIAIRLIRVPVHLRGSGHGERALSIVCRWADRNGKTLTLTPDGVFGSDLGRLVAWYLRHGFTARRGIASMTRYPNAA